MHDVFSIDSAMSPVGDGTMRGTVSRNWWIIGGPNGGYMAAMVLRGLTRAVEDDGRSPRSLTVHFTRRPEPGRVDLLTCVERHGRGMTTVSGKLVQAQRIVGVALAAFSVDRTGLEFDRAPMPTVPPPQECPELTTLAVKLPMARQLELRWALGSPPFAGGGDEPVIGAWIRLAERRVADAPQVAFMTDALPPSVYSTVESGDEMGGVPTVDLTVHFRSPVPDSARDDDWYLATFASRTARGGFVDEDGEVWTQDGVLLAQSRQLAVMLGGGQAAP